MSDRTTQDVVDQLHDSEESRGAQQNRRSDWARRVLIGAGALTFTAAVAAAGLLAWQVKQHHDLESAGIAALDTARNYAVTLTSVDDGNIDENFEQVLDGATGEFRDIYGQSSAQLRQALVDNAAVSRGTVVDAAVKTVTADEVEVLIFIDQSISNRIDPGPRIDRSRISMTMERIDGRWLASKVDVK
ncbi:hypothetical protein [[Mycobacterium] wendilense]|uniref:Mce protein n=1 Tax=[Mycobacterium] wendilense TaxID=3064284 RepID=A0ABM9MJM0_9MYCO|nr:hypothetical protein [Mycolicibacterium sp. MU0050]CAJ1586824.1 hypothetical protein MU0050_004473 [Mycolicibacterium sp. MU0050]